jgi:hypothetical protein
MGLFDVLTAESVTFEDDTENIRLHERALLAPRASEPREGGPQTKVKIGSGRRGGSILPSPYTTPPRRLTLRLQALKLNGVLRLSSF